MRYRFRTLCALVAATGLVVAACTSGGGAAPPGGVPGGGQANAPASYPRNETLFTSGTQWGPPANWNPIMSGWYRCAGLSAIPCGSAFFRCWRSNRPASEATW